MGRASRRKQANGGPGFFRHAHALAALTASQETPQAAAERAAPTEEAHQAEEAPHDGATHDPAPDPRRR